MDDEGFLRDSAVDLDSSLRESLEQTGGKIGENLETLSKRGMDLQDKIARIKLEISGYQMREGQLAAYAQKILQKKRDLDEQKEAHEFEVKQKEEDLKLEMSKLSSKIEALAQRSKEIQGESEVNEKSKQELTRKIDELSAMEDNVRDEKSKLTSRISVLNSQIDMEMISERNHEVRKMQQSVRELESQTQFAERSFEQVEDNEVILRGDIRSCQMNLKRSLNQKETRTHIYAIEIEGLKRKLARAKEEFDVELEGTKSSEILIAHLRDELEFSKTNLDTTRVGLRRVKGMMESAAKQLVEKERTLAAIEDELSRVRESVEVLRNSHNKLELEKLSAIKQVKEKRIAARRKAGEEILQKKRRNRAIRSGNVQLQKIIRKTKQADDIARLLDRGYELLDKKQQVPEDPQLAEELIQTLDKLNQHIAIAIRYSEALQNHKYTEVRACVAEPESQAIIDMKQQLKAVRKENKKLQRMINRKSPQPVEERGPKAICPLFSHATTSEFQAVFNTPSHNTHHKLDNSELEKKVQEKRNSLHKRKLSIQRRRQGLVNASEVFMCQPDLNIECTKFCNVCGHRVNQVNLTVNDWITLTDELRKQIQIWHVSTYPPDAVLKVWNNRLEHFIRSRAHR